MGRELDRFSLSRFAFLRRGETRECLKTIGKLPVESERLMILVITGTSTEAQSFRREVGIGSSSRCLLERESKQLQFRQTIIIFINPASILKERQKFYSVRPKLE